MKTILGLLLTMFIFSTSVNAMLYLEPMIGLEKYIMDNSSSDATEMEVMIGGRAGFSMLGFVFGGEYTKVDEWDRIAAFAAFKAPILPLRVFARYFIDLGDYSDYDTSNGFGLGVGFTGLPFLSINLDFNKYTIKNSVWDLSGSEFILSVSMPFDL